MLFSQRFFKYSLLLFSSISLNLKILSQKQPCFSYKHLGHFHAAVTNSAQHPLLACFSQMPATLQKTILEAHSAEKSLSKENNDAYINLMYGIPSLYSAFDSLEKENGCRLTSGKDSFVQVSPSCFVDMRWFFGDESACHVNFASMSYRGQTVFAKPVLERLLSAPVNDLAILENRTTTIKFLTNNPETLQSIKDQLAKMAEYSAGILRYVSLCQGQQIPGQPPFAIRTTHGGKEINETSFRLGDYYDIYSPGHQTNIFDLLSSHKTLEPLKKTLYPQIKKYNKQSMLLNWNTHLNFSTQTTRDTIFCLKLAKDGLEQFRMFLDPKRSPHTNKQSAFFELKDSNKPFFQRKKYLLAGLYNTIFAPPIQNLCNLKNRWTTQKDNNGNALKPNYFIAPFKSIWDIASFSLDANIIREIYRTIFEAPKKIIKDFWQEKCLKFAKTFQVESNALKDVSAFLAETINLIEILEPLPADSPLFKGLALKEDFANFKEIIESKTKIGKLLTYLCEKETFSRINPTLSLSESILQGDLGHVLKACLIMAEHWHEIFPLLEAIGELDAYCSLATLVEESKDRETKYTIAKFAQTFPEKSYLSLKNAWHPAVKSNKPVGNDVNLGGNNERFMMLTGINSGGKSTFMRSLIANVLLAQSVGIFAADNDSEIQLFDALIYYKNRGENASEGISTNVAEHLDANAVLEKFEEITENKKSCLAIVDEMYSGTNETDASIFTTSIAEEMCENLSPAIIGCWTTHTQHAPEKIESSTKGLFKNYKIVINKSDDVQKTLTYKLSPGINTDTIAGPLTQKLLPTKVAARIAKKLKAAGRMP